MEAKRESFLVIKDGHLSEEASALLVEALRQGKTVDVPEEVLAHVDVCRECKDNVLEVVTFLRNPDAAGQFKQLMRRRGETRGDWSFYRGKIAAVFVVFALLAGVYFLADRGGSVQDVAVQAPSVVQGLQEAGAGKVSSVTVPETRETTDPPGLKPGGVKKSNTHIPDDRYRVNPNLESMIGSRLRSGSFEISGPPDGSVVREPVHFFWKKALVATHTLKIVTNRGQVLHTYPVQGDGFIFTQRLMPGLYYWKLESRNELLYVGKFFIGQPPQGNTKF